MIRKLVGLTAVFALVSAASCNNSRIGDYSGPPGPGAFGSDAGLDPSSRDLRDGGLISYCPTTACPAPFTTCPESRFPCDVNVTNDPLNCGSCGFACPQIHPSASFDCVAGKCVMSCLKGNAWTADCNGVVDDDCEVKLGTNENCNGCGDECPDQAKPCLFDVASGKGRCGCPGGLSFCGGGCIDLKSSDENCNTCGNVCDPTGNGSEPRRNAHYGCSGGECGHLKCDRYYAECDDDPETGCETDLLSQTSCGSCTNACAPGQTCLLDDKGEPACMCPAGKTLCAGRCVDTATDPANCGTCSVSCKGLAPNEHGIGYCKFGSCVYECEQGWGDCNGDPSDGCETNLGADQRHCGACGHACSAIEGQPCVAGQCAVEPCEEGENAR